MAKNAEEIGDKHSGRPPIYTDEKVEEIRQAMEQYIEDTEIPILAEFAFQYDIRRQTLYELPGLSDTVKRLAEKKEFTLEKMAMVNKVNPTFAIFSLKQMGWRDRFEHQVSGDISIGKPPSPEDAEFPGDES